MKTTKNNYALAATFAAATLLFACNNGNDNKNRNDSIYNDTSASAAHVVPDSAATNSDTTAAAPADTSAAKIISDNRAGSKTSTAKRNPAKKGHKGKSRIAIYSPDYSVKMAEDKNGIYNYAEVLPMFPGGQKALDRFIEDNIQYPQDAMDNGVEGTVIVVFAVNENGKIFSPKLKNEKLGYGLDEAALNAVDKMPKWTPGNIKGKNVKSYYQLPITFTLQ